MLVSAKDMLEKAREGKYAVGQFNINNLDRVAAAGHCDSTPVGTLSGGGDPLFREARRRLFRGVTPARRPREASGCCIADSGRGCVRPGRG